MIVELYQGDCLEVLEGLKGRDVDAVICDPPFGVTRCKWDSVIPLDQMWEKLNLVCHDRTPIVLFGKEPFSSNLRVSNLKNFKYDWIWHKTQATGFFNAKKRPMDSHEIISVFYKKQPKYYPQKTTGHPLKTAVKKKQSNSALYNGNVKDCAYSSTERYPRSVITFKKDNKLKSIHSTQKPESLIEYLILTYTDPGDTVLDFTMGSGTTGAVCKKLNRNFIGIELDQKYFKIAKERINAI